MIKTFDMRDRERPLDVYGPPGPARALPAGAAPRHRAHRLPARRDRARAPRGGRLRRLRDRGVPGQATASRPTATRSSRTTGPGRFDVEAARALGVTEGPDFGRLQRGETVNGVTPEQVVGADRPGRRIVYTGDTAPVQTVEVYAARRRRARPRGDVLRGRARPRARDRPLDRPPGRRDRARGAGVKLLALTHLSTRYFPREIRDEARAVFENTVVPRDFDAIEVPFPERGEPELVKAELRAGAIVLTPC